MKVKKILIDLAKRSVVPTLVGGVICAIAVIGVVNPSLWAQAMDDYVWVANSNDDNVTRIKKSDSTTTTIAVGRTPRGVAVDETYCWVTNVGNNNVTRIKKSDSTTTAIAVGDNPRGVAVDETYVWVVNYGSNNCTRIKKSDSTTTTIAVGTRPYNVAVDEIYVWVANNSSDNVTRIKKSDSTIRAIAVGTKPSGVAVDETYCWVANSSDNNVTRIKKSDSTTTAIAVGNYPCGVAVDETYVWVANYSSKNVTRIKKSDSTTTAIAVGGVPCGVAVDETYCWVTNIGDNNVTRIKKSDSTTTTIAVGRDPFSLGDMTGYAYCRLAIIISIKPDVLELKPSDDLGKIIDTLLTDLRETSKRPRSEAILVGLKEKSLGALVTAFKDEAKKDEESYQILVKEINRLIPQLGSDEWQEREQSQKRLETIGAKSIQALKEAKEKSSDPEIRMRARQALDQINLQGYSPLELKRREFISSILNIMGNIGSLKQPALTCPVPERYRACFVRSLSDNDYFLRRLSYGWLKKLTGKELPFDPTKSPDEEASHIKAWESLIEKEFSK